MWGGLDPHLCSLKSLLFHMTFLSRPPPRAHEMGWVGKGGGGGRGERGGRRGRVPSKLQMLMCSFLACSSLDAIALLPKCCGFSAAWSCFDRSFCWCGVLTEFHMSRLSFVAKM